MRCPNCDGFMEYIEETKNDDGSIWYYYECDSCDYDENFTRAELEDLGEAYKNPY